MNESTQDKWRILCKELGFANGASFSSAMMQVKSLRQARDREITLAGHVRRLLQHARYTDRGKVLCALCKKEFYGKHTDQCAVGELRDLVTI